MALLDPLRVFLLPLLLLATIPLALFASITTLLAFSVLCLRVMLVYLDVALSLLPQSLLLRRPYRYRLAATAATTPTTPAIRTSRSPSPTLHRRRRRPSSSHSAVSDGSVASLAGLGLMPSVGPDRDYEGIGGWRVGVSAHEDAWLTVSPRAEVHHGGARSLHHHAGSSGGMVTPGEGGLMMKSTPRGSNALKLSVPNSAKPRTPPHLRGPVDSYFPTGSRAASPKSLR